MITQFTCPGKINLFLDVTGVRENGYHDILTFFLPVSGIEDNITISEAESLTIECSQSGVPTDNTNLCWQAAVKFSEISGIEPKWNIAIDKNLPVAGGMGGGSSNAGLVMKKLAGYYCFENMQILKETALSIGADVPYFLNPVPAIAEGVGEDLQAVQILEKIPMIIVTFNFPVSAAWAYKNRSQKFGASGICKDQLLKKWNNDSYFDLVYNDLGFAVREKFPIVDLTCRDLLEFGAEKSEVSGSGPSVFGLFRSIADRDECAAKLKNRGIPPENIYSCFAG